MDLDADRRAAADGKQGRMAFHRVGWVIEGTGWRSDATWAAAAAAATSGVVSNRAPLSWDIIIVDVDIEGGNQIFGGVVEGQCGGEEKQCDDVVVVVEWSGVEWSGGCDGGALLGVARWEDGGAGEERQSMTRAIDERMLQLEISIDRYS
jgi:hypothetical protein